MVVLERALDTVDPVQSNKWAQAIVNGIVAAHTDSSEQKRQIRAVCCALRRPWEAEDGSLADRLMRGDVCASNVGNMSSESMLSRKASAMAKKIRVHHVFSPRQALALSAQEGLFRCRCGSRKTVHFQLQTACGDEGMRTTVDCVSCGRRFRA